MRAPRRGFTLVEVLVTVVIVGILFAIGVPSYRSYTIRTNRTVAKAAIAEIASRQESWYVDHKGYATGLSRLGYPADIVYLGSDQVTSAASSTSSLYKLSLAGNYTLTTCPTYGTPDRTGYSILAEPINAQQGDTLCGKLCLTSTGLKSAGGTQPANCWKR